METLGPYTLLEEIGAGGMGRVYRAQHQRLNRLVAVKVIQPDSQEDKLTEARFQREMRIAASLSHPNLVRMFDCGQEGNVHYIAMELLEGRPLSQLIQARARLSIPQFLKIALGMADALQALHSADIIHRDIKPSNIFVMPDGSPKLLDFGLARPRDATMLTEAGAMVGTIPYLAPEIILRNEYSEATDFWATGCAFYNILTKKLPVELGKLPRLLDRITDDPIPMVHELDPTIPLNISDVVRDLLTHNPTHRLRDPSELKRRLLSTTAGPRSPSPPIVRPAPDRLSTRYTKYAFLAIWMGVLLACGWAVLRPGLQTPTARPSPKRSAARAAHAAGFHQWRRVEPLLSRLGGKRVDAPTHAALRRTVTVDLGTDPARWTFWVKLGRWLNSPDRAPDPPHGQHANSAPVQDIDSKKGEDLDVAFREVIRLAFQRDAQLLKFSRLMELLEWLEHFPGDCRAWFVLGWLLEIEENEPAAHLAYARGLKLQTPGILRGWGPVVWAGFARALTHTPGHDLEREWLQAVQTGAPEPAPFWSLKVAHKGPQVEKLLLKAAEIPDYSTLALAQLGSYYIENAYPRKAHAVWSRLKGNHKATEFLAYPVLQNLLAWGDLDAARDCAQSEPAASLTRIEYEYCVGPPAKAPLRHGPWEKLMEGERADQLEVLRLLELGQASQALTCLNEAVQRRRARGSHFVLAPFIAVAGAQIGGPEIDEEARRQLFDPTAPLEVRRARWTLAAGSLPRRELMKTWLDAAALEPWAPTLDLKHLLAVWASRNGQQRQAIQDLPWTAETQGEAFAGEVLIRALWRERLGLKTDPGAAAAARAIRPPAAWEETREGRYWRALVAGDLSRTRDLSRAIPDATNSVVMWLLAEAYDTVAAADIKTRDRTFHKLRTQARYWCLGPWLLRELAELDTVAPPR